MEGIQPRITGEKRKEQILDVASNLFGQYGFDNVSTKKLAAEIGCSEALIYKYFPSKESIFEQLFHEWMESQKKPIKLEIIDNSALKTLKHYYESFINGQWEVAISKGQRPSLGKAILTSNIHRERVLDAISHGSDITKDTLLPVIELGQKQGEIRQGDAYAIAVVFNTFIEGALNLHGLFSDMYEFLPFEKILFIFTDDC